MRMIDDDSSKKLDNITLFLTMAEAKQLRGALNAVIEEPTDANHRHVSSADYQKEITVCIYDPENLAGFNERSKKLILEDK